MIELQTGLPGACKTLFTLDRLERLRIQTKRPIFYVARDQGDDLAPGIVELTLPWIPIKVEDWPTCPPGSIVVIDECQKVPGFRPRPNAVSAPSWAEPAMETHRGKGIDLVLICQHPSQLHVGIRRLVGIHRHAVRKFGFPVSTIHEWGSVKDNCDKSRADSQKLTYKFNKRAYAYYKSAEVHTHKIRVPMKVVGLALICLVVPLLAYFAFMQLRGFGKSGADVAPVPGQAASAVPGQFLGGSRAAPLTPVEYAQAYAPRVVGLAYTAPAYDKVTEPSRAPYPAACISTSSRCQCYSQQATRLEVGDDLCRKLAAGGFFVAWGEGGEHGRAPPVRDGGAQ